MCCKSERRSFGIRMHLEDLEITTERLRGKVYKWDVREGVRGWRKGDWWVGLVFDARRR